MRRSIYSKYPVLVAPESLPKVIGVSISNISDLVDYMKSFTDRAIIRIEHAVRGSYYVPSDDPLIELPSFYLAIALAQHTHSWLLRRLADHEGKRVALEIARERDKDVVNVLKNLGIEVEYIGEEDGCGHRVFLGRSGTSEVVACYPYRLTIPKYLRYAERLFTEPSWKLVNRLVLKGYVFLGKKDLARLAEEEVKKRVIEYGRVFSAEFIGELLREQLGIAKSLVPKEVLERERKRAPEKIERAFPPCITKLRELLSKGEHLSHHQRFALATFMLSVGYSVDEVVDMFRTSPDFEEKIARYQVEHLAGLRGGRKKYRMYSCDKMKSLGLCVAECGTRTPLQYYRRAAIELETR
ncbi:MAG: hypothetical protein QXD83_03245 [Sulfolobales archaeon]